MAGDQLLARPIPERQNLCCPLAARKDPATHPGGIHSEEEVSYIPGARRINAVNRQVRHLMCATWRHTTQRNLYQIPIP